ncbi:MAG: hypothetical protein AAGA81_19635 [Acidobacteriota bacterium]
MPDLLSRALRSPFPITLLLAAFAAPTLAQTNCAAIRARLDELGHSYTESVQFDHCQFNVTTRDGDTFIMRDGKNGTYTLADLAGVQPLDGNWEFHLTPETTTCPGEDHSEIVRLLPMIIRTIHQTLGSTDGGASAPYDFRTPFTLSQLLGPFFSRLQQSGIQVSSVNYGRNGNLHTVVSHLQQPSVFDIGFKFEVGVVGPGLIMGNFQAKTGDCNQTGSLEWRRQ